MGGWNRCQRPQHGISQHTTDLIHKVFGTDLTQLLLEHLPIPYPRYGIPTALANQNHMIPLQELVKGNFSHDPGTKKATQEPVRWLDISGVFMGASRRFTTP